MDIITHAVVGACTGAMFGHPILGGVVAAAPDIVLGVKRRSLPTALYNATHSLLSIVLGALLALPFGIAYSACVGLALLSHIVLDIPTHGKDWAPPLFYPFTSTRFSYYGEWEFFNDHWWRGLCLAIVWGIVCLQGALLLGTGCPLLPSAQLIDFQTFCMFP